jgi:hypothetical protein
MRVPTLTIPSQTTAGGHGGPLRLSRPAVRAFAERRTEPAAAESRFMADFLASYGMEPDPVLYARGGGNSFISMGRELLGGLDRALPAMDLLLLAYHLPDLQIFEVAGCYLAELCPGRPAAFSVSGLGVGAPFTALRILSCMRLTGGLADGAVLVLDQSTSPYRDPDVHDGAVRDCAVLLSTDTAGAGDGAVLDFVDEQAVIDPADPLRALARRIPRVRIVAGCVLADRLDPDFRIRHSIVTGPRHRLCTSAWAALAEHWPRDRYTVVADYDPHEGRLFQAGLRPGART